MTEPKSAAPPPLVGFRPTQTLRASIIQWAEKQPDTPDLSEAVRRLVEIALKELPIIERRRENQKTRASDLAGDAIDGLVDGGVEPDEKASRKHRLIKGPNEFLEARVDGKKTEQPD